MPRRGLFEAGLTATMDSMSRALGPSLAMLVAVLFAIPARPADVSVDTCGAAKMRAVGQRAKNSLVCYAKAATQDSAVDGAPNSTELTFTDYTIKKR